MKSTVKILLAVLGLSVSLAPQVLAGTYMTGTIHKVFMKPDEKLVYVKVTGSEFYTSSCKGNPNYDFIFKTDTVEGMLTYAMVVSAYNKQSAMEINGTGTCELHEGVETLSNMALQ